MAPSLSSVADRIYLPSSAVTLRNPRRRLARKRKPSDIEVISNWLALLLVLGLVFASITFVGDLLGLTPSVDEMTDRPDGWVGRNYEGIVVGYALTALFLAVVIVGAWLAIRTQSRVTQQADVARYLLPRVGWFGAALLVAIAVVPVGKRANVEGNVPKLVGMSAAEAAGELEDASLRASFRRRSSGRRALPSRRTESPPRYQRGRGRDGEHSLCDPCPEGGRPQSCTRGDASFGPRLRSTVCE